MKNCASTYRDDKIADKPANLRKKNKMSTTLRFTLGILGALVVFWGHTSAKADTISRSISQYNELDIYNFDGRAGQVFTISVEVEPGSRLDPVVGVYFNGRMVAFDDDSGRGNNALIENFRVPSTGRYSIVVSSHLSRSMGRYRISLNESGSASRARSSADANRAGSSADISLNQTRQGSISRGGERDVYSFDGRSGQQIDIAVNARAGSDLDPVVELWYNQRRIAYDDDGGGQVNSLIDNFRLPSTGRYLIRVIGYDDSERGSYTLRVSAADRAPTVDNSGAGVRSSAGNTGFGAPVQGQISRNGERDVYRFSLNRSTVVTIAMDAESGGLDPYLYLQTASGQTIARDDDGGPGRNAMIRRRLNSGTYRIVAAGYSGRSTGSYRLSLSETGSTGSNNSSRVSSSNSVNTRAAQASNTNQGRPTGRAYMTSQIISFRLLRGQQQWTADIQNRLLRTTWAFDFASRTFVYAPEGRTPMQGNFTIHGNTLVFNANRAAGMSTALNMSELIGEVDFSSGTPVLQMSYIGSSSNAAVVNGTHFGGGSRVMWQATVRLR